MRNFLAKFLFIVHSLFVIFWWGLFFIPKSVWPEKVSFHFYLTIFVILQQLFWGFLIMPWTKKYRMVCFLTTATQVLRGKNISDPQNYNHSFVKESFGKMGITLPHRGSLALTLLVLFVVTIQYVLSH